MIPFATPTLPPAAPALLLSGDWYSFIIYYGTATIVSLFGVWLLVRYIRTEIEQYLKSRKEEHHEP
jgi:hypothetical protein